MTPAGESVSGAVRPLAHAPEASVEGRFETHQFPNERVVARICIATVAPKHAVQRPLRFVVGQPGTGREQAGVA